MLKRSLVSALDQAVTSGLNFAIGLALIALLPKAAYGLYVQLFAAGVLMTVLVDAFLGNGITNALAREGPQALERWLQRGRVAMRVLAAVLAALGAGVALGLNALAGEDAQPALPLALCYGAYVWTLLQREFARTRFHLREQPERVLQLDASYAAAAVALGLGLHLLGGVDVAGLWLCLALANGLALALARGGEPGLAALAWAEVGAALARVWGWTRWSVVGGAVGWVANNVFLYASGLALGLAMTAELNAARLLLMPLTLMSVAWGQTSRAALARLVQAGDRAGLSRYVRRSVGGLLGVGLGYGTALGAAWGWIVQAGPFAGYAHMGELLRWWLPYMLMFAVKFVGTVVMTVMEQYRPMLLMACASLALQLALLAWLPGLWGAPGVIVCLMASEALELVVIWRVLMPTAWARRAREQASG